METFRTKYGDKKRDYHFNAPSGEKIMLKHRAQMHKDGTRELIKDVKYPIYEIIQSHREETEIERIVKRAVEGDTTALNAMNGVYADIADAPGSLGEAQAMIINAKNEFYELPIEIREKFDQDAEKYVASMGTPEWCDKMGITEKLKMQKAETTENIAPTQVVDIANQAGAVIENTEVTVNE